MVDKTIAASKIRPTGWLAALHATRVACPAFMLPSIAHGERIHETRAVVTPEATDRRQSLIIAARSLIAERGFEGLRVREVAQRVGINHATLHHYFPSKEVLVECVLGDTVRSLATFRAAQNASAVPAREALRAYLHAARAHMRDDPTPFMVLSEFFLRARRDVSLAGMLRQLDEGWSGFFVSLVKRGQREGDFRRDLDPAAVARILTTYLRGVRLPIADKGTSLAREHTQIQSWIVVSEDSPTR